jgi:branched-chain amino acid transport system substrate-binding protein
MVGEIDGMRRRFVSLMTVALGLALLAGPALAQETLKLGVLTALSGSFAAAGTFQMNGFKLAVQDLNAAGGVEIGGKKYKLDLIVYDTHCNAAEASSATQRLASVDNVPVIMGETCTPAALTEAPIASDAGVPIIFTIPGAPSITDQRLPDVFRVSPNQNQTTAALAKFVAKENLQPLGFLAWNSDAGRVGVKLMTQMLPKDFKIAYVGYFNNGDVDFRSQIANLKESGAKAVMLLMDEEPGSLAIRQMHENGLSIQLIGTLAMGSNRFLDRLDKASLAGMIQYNTFPPNAQIPRIKEFSERYRKAYGEESHGWAANSYDAVMVSIDAMKRAGTVTDRDKIDAALKTTDWDGVAGKIRFGPDGQADTPVYVTQWCADGTRSILYPPELVASCGNG